MNKFLLPFFVCLLSLRALAQVPTATIVSPPNPLCSNSELTFSTITTNSPTSYNWSILPTSSITVLPNYNSSTITFKFGVAGTYSISLLVSNSTGTSVTSTNINVSQSAKASFNASLIAVGFPNQLQLTNFSTNSSSNQWLFNDDVLANTNSFNTIKNYSVSGSYNVTLIAYGNLGCNDTTHYDFRIGDSSAITLPTIFSPNGDDVNEVFKPICSGISNLSLSIYNRYGTMLISWDRVNGFWDGHTTSGERCEAGVYFVILEANGFDGKSYKLHHSLTLVR